MCVSVCRCVSVCYTNQPIQPWMTCPCGSNIWRGELLTQESQSALSSSCRATFVPGWTTHELMFLAREVRACAGIHQMSPRLYSEHPHRFSLSSVVGSSSCGSAVQSPWCLRGMKKISESYLVTRWKSLLLQKKQNNKRKKNTNRCQHSRELQDEQF